MRIAVVDDDTAFLDLIVWLFRERGWDVLTYRGGDETLAEIAREKPDLLILDIHLEGDRSGWELMALLEADPRTYPIPIIVCSAALPEVAGQEDRLVRRNIPFLPKPFDIDDLYQMVDAALDRGRAQRRAGA